MKIKFAEDPQPRLTFADVAVGQVFRFQGCERHSLLLKTERSTVFSFDASKDYVVKTGDLNDSVYDVAEIESITLRRVK